MGIFSEFSTNIFHNDSKAYNIYHSNIYFCAYVYCIYTQEYDRLDSIGHVRTIHLNGIKFQKKHESEPS